MRRVGMNVLMIDQERVIDTTIPPEMLNAVYVPGDGWTKVVPEPASAAVLLAGAAALLRRKRRPWRR